MKTALFAFLLGAGVVFSAQKRTTIVPAPARPAPSEPAGSPAASPAPSPPVVIRRREVPVPRPEPGRVQAPSLGPRPGPPATNRQGAPFRADLAQTPPRHTTIVRDPDFTSTARRLERLERRRGLPYWHTLRGDPFCHYYDGSLHWYGFYSGPDFYWTRLYGGRWWWYDLSFQRWVFWWDGYWWWPHPAGATYVFVDNNYYPYESAPGRVTTKDPSTDQPPPPPPGSAAQGSVYNSPDGRRFVQVLEPRREAFLYAYREGQPVFLKYLAKDVRSARFLAAPGRPRLRLDLADGTFALYDLEGRPLDD